MIFTAFETPARAKDVKITEKMKIDLRASSKYGMSILRRFASRRKQATIPDKNAQASLIFAPTFFVISSAMPPKNTGMQERIIKRNLFEKSFLAIKKAIQTKIRDKNIAIPPVLGTCQL
jgi:transposase